MSRKDNSKSSKLHFKRDIKKNNKVDYIEATEGMYTAKSFLGNLSLSMGKDPNSLYPEKADKIFKINDLVDLRLINNKTYIYINNTRFVQCFNLLFNVEPYKSQNKDNITNMDKASQILGGRYSSWFMKISPEEAFMAHCSNIQAFFENELNTDILHSDIAFPLLKKLVQLEYKPAEKIFTSEIVKRYNEGTWESRRFLSSEGYLKYLNKEEKRALKKDKHARLFKDIPFPRDLYIETEKKRYGEDFTKVLGAQLIKIFEFDGMEMKFKYVKKTLPLDKLLDANKILLFKDPSQAIVWIWHGTNITTRMKYYARNLATKKYGMRFTVKIVDEGIEPLEFKRLVKLKKESASLYREKILSSLEKLKKEKKDGTQLFPSEDWDIYFELIEEEIRKIKSIMKENSVNKLTIHREYFPEVFNAKLLEISKIDGFPSFKPGVLICFEYNGIYTKIFGNVFTFFKVYRLRK